MGVLAGLAGCQKTESTTEIVLEISTNIPVPAGMDTLSLKVGPQANPQAFAKTYTLGSSAGQIMLPRRMTLVPTDVGTVLSVLVEGLQGGKAVVSRSVITSFAKGQSKFLSIELLQKCAGQICPTGQTCTPSAFCADPRIDPATLPTFDPSQRPNTPGLDPDAGATVDAPSASDGQNDGLFGKDGSRVDGLPGGERGPSGDGQTGSDGVVTDVVVPGPDGSVAVDAPAGPDGPPVVKLDAGSAVDAPVKISDVPPASKTKGVACGLSGECESGLCIDGVCCESKCDGMCMACNVPGKMGTCSLVPLNDPSGGDCPDEGVATCGRNGKCNGQGGCMTYPSGVACSAETCPLGTSIHTRAGLCDGQGRCAQGQVQDCAPFLCNPTSKTCNPTCTTYADCVSPNQCTNGSCGQKGNGLPCTAPGDCLSNVCAQGVCCAGPCTDLCKSCAVDGSLGTCTNLPPGKSDVQARCLDQGVDTCGSNGLCDGAGACQKYPDGLSCSAQCNAAAATFTSFACGAGTCNPGAPQSCSPYSCDSTGCKKSCTVLADCAVGFVCGAGGLCVRPPENCMNGVDDDGDGQADCADTDCQPGFTCVPAAPAGFTGPVALAEGATQADLPACGGAHSVESFTGWGSPQCPFTCSACGCALPTGVDCSNPTIAMDNLAPREFLICPRPTIELPLDTCLPVTGTYNSYITVAGTPSGGSCTPSGGNAVKTPVGWIASRICRSQAAGGAGCAAGLVCWPKPPTPYQPQACVVGTGNLDCPASGYIKKHDYYTNQDINDTRDCTSTCTCGSPSGMTCPAHVGVFSERVSGREQPCDSSLLLDEATIPSPCTRLSSNIGFVKAITKIKLHAGGSCTPSGDAFATGTCTPTGPQSTVCCMP
jgi:hypothetical protein